MSVPQSVNTAVVGTVFTGVASAVSWTDIRDDLSIVASVVAIIVGLATLWRMIKDNH